MYIGSVSSQFFAMREATEGAAGTRLTKLRRTGGGEGGKPASDLLSEQSHLCEQRI